MDCRKPLVVTLGLLCGLTGCNLTNPTPTASVSPPPPSSQIAALPPKKETDLPKKSPQAATCVAYGNFAADEARHADNPILAEQQRDTARKAYQQALAIDPKCLPAYQGLTALYVAMNDYKHATATYQDALRRFPKEPSLYYEIGMLYARQKDWEPALQSLTKAADIDPESRKYNNTLGFCLARAGRYDDSLKVFQRLESEQEAHYHVACMLQHLNETELAKQHVLAALQQNPEMKDALALWSELNANPPAPPARDVLQTNFIDVTPQ